MEFWQSDTSTCCLFRQGLASCMLLSLLFFPEASLLVHTFQQVLQKSFDQFLHLLKFLHPPSVKECPCLEPSGSLEPFCPFRPFRQPLRKLFQLADLPHAEQGLLHKVLLHKECLPECLDQILRLWSCSQLTTLVPRQRKQRLQKPHDLFRNLS